MIKKQKGAPAQPELLTLNRETIRSLKCDDIIEVLLPPQANGFRLPVKGKVTYKGPTSITIDYEYTDTDRPVVKHLFHIINISENRQFSYVSKADHSATYVNEVEEEAAVTTTTTTDTTMANTDAEEVPATAATTTTDTTMANTDAEEVPAATMVNTDFMLLNSLTVVGLVIGDIIRVSALNATIPPVSSRVVAIDIARKIIKVDYNTDASVDQHVYRDFTVDGSFRFCYEQLAPRNIAATGAQPQLLSAFNAHKATQDAIPTAADILKFMNQDIQCMEELAMLLKIAPNNVIRIKQLQELHTQLSELILKDRDIISNREYIAPTILSKWQELNFKLDSLTRGDLKSAGAKAAPLLKKQ